MAVRLEIRDGGFYRVQDVFDRQHVSRIFPGWHILFTDAQGVKRVGYVRSINEERKTLRIIDGVQYPNAPYPVNVSEVIPWENVLAAGMGYSRSKREVYEGSRKIGVREVFMIREDADVGFIARKASATGRVYVEKRNGRWEVR
jgi:hypothetical protein